MDLEFAENAGRTSDSSYALRSGFDLEPILHSFFPNNKNFEFDISGAMNGWANHEDAMGIADEVVEGGAASILAPVTGAGGSLHDEILAELRRYLIEGSLADGARIPERLLCETMKVSRTPLREALKVLASEGLVELLPNRGARVRAFTENDIRELFEVMGGLEALAGRLACEHITDAEIASVEQLHYDMYASYMRRDLPTYFALNQKIHLEIVAAARNSVLATTYANFSSRMQRVRYNANRENHKDRWGEAMREHEQILDALQRRAGLELSDILFRHLQNKRVAALRYLDDHPSEAGDQS